MTWSTPILAKVGVGVDLDCAIKGGSLRGKASGNMVEQSDRSIQIQESAVGSAIVSGDGNTIYVIHQTTQPRQEPAADTPVKLGPNPYQGLAAFTENDGDRYFGREAQIQRLWQRFQDLPAQSTQANAVPRLLPILGPSGCGKSSLARAGLIPELARRPLPGKTALWVAVLRRSILFAKPLLKGQPSSTLNQRCLGF